MVIDVFGTKVEVFFNGYNTKTKKHVEVDVKFTDAHRREVMNEMDSTDSGTFYTSTCGDVITTGHFSF